VTLIVDAGALYAQANRRDAAHTAVAHALRSETGLLVTSELAVAEADYLILTRLGLDVELAFLRYRTVRLATLNLRDFRAVKPIQGGAFVLLPADD
jgi:predicted nucleic acid-binding protein